MKKIIVSILAVLYMSASSGMTIHAHYCMGKIISVNLGDVDDKSHKCTNCGMEERKGCCDEKQTIIKIEKEHNAVQSSFYFSTYVSYVALPAFIEVNTSDVTNINSSLLDASGFSRSQTLPIFIRNSVFRI